MKKRTPIFAGSICSLLLATIASAVDLSTEADVLYVFSADIPNTATAARIVIEAINDGGSEQFSFSEVLFADVRTSLIPGTNNFSPDLTAGNFSQVRGSVVGATDTTVLNHDPGVNAEGFCRVSLSRAIAIPGL